MLHSSIQPFRRRFVHIISVLVPAAAVLTAGDAVWKSKPISQWTADEARQVLAESPWAKPTRIAILPKLSEDQLREGGRMGGGNTRFALRPSAEPDLAATRKAGVTVRWESALPIRAAELKSGDTTAPVWDGDYYAIAVDGIPGVTPVAQKALRGELKQTTYLRRSDKKTLRPERVDILISGTDVARIVYLFSRSAELTGSDARVQFVTQVGRVVVNQSFDLGEMQLQGKLEL